MVPALTLGTGTFGGGNDFFRGFGATDVAGARRLVGICLEAGVFMFDSADNYSDGLAEEILGRAVEGHRDEVLLSTKATFRVGAGPNDVGSSRQHILRSCESALKRLRTDHIDLYQMHAFDALTPVEEVLRTLDDLVRSGKVRYIGCSNFSGWHIMKSLAASDRLGLERYVAHQAYYSLVGREYEWELMPLGVDQGVGTVVWSPLGWGRLTGKVRRGQPPPPTPGCATSAPLPVARRSTRSTCTGWWTRWTRSRARPARRSRRSRSTGSSPGRPSRRSSSAPATRSSCATTSGRPAGT